MQIISSTDYAPCLANRLSLFYSSQDLQGVWRSTYIYILLDI